LGRRSRKREATGRRNAPPAGPRAERRASRSEARNAEARAKLAPLGPGERPPALVVAAGLAVALAIANLALYAGGLEVQGERPSAAGVVLFALLMLVAAVGMWQLRYWAVLGFQALLGLSIVIAAISLVVASNLAAVALCLGIIAVAGPLFWKLIRVMARIQMPERPWDRRR
jgi:hypothetical protein